METVLIADHDLGFVFWLAHRLNQSDYCALPALNLGQAAMMAKQFEFDMLVIEASLPDAASLVKLMRRSRRHLKVVSLSPGDKARLEQVRDLETALRLGQSQVCRGEFLEHSEFLGNRLAASRAALTGALLGAAFWAVLIALFIPR